VRPTVFIPILICLSVANAVEAVEPGWYGDAPPLPVVVPTSPVDVGFGRMSRLPSPKDAIQPAAYAPDRMQFVDLDAYYDGHEGSVNALPVGIIHADRPPAMVAKTVPNNAWQWQLLPKSMIYPAYLASTKESRFAAHVFSQQADGWLMDGILGARVGLVRFGDHDPWLPQGWQIDAEGSAHLRLDIPENVDVRSVDFRGGVPITYGVGRHRMRFGYYHMSSHLGDEFLLRYPGFPRQNYSRDVLIVGHTFFWTERLRSYVEAGWAFKDDISDQWEFQFGLDFAPTAPTGLRGAPFLAMNAHLREAVNYGGGLTVQTGWAWHTVDTTSLLRVGLYYYNGESNQFSFFDDHEEQIGFGAWYDF
jgi:hypothetical protein